MKQFKKGYLFSSLIIMASLNSYGQFFHSNSSKVNFEPLNCLKSYSINGENKNGKFSGFINIYEGQNVIRQVEYNESKFNTLKIQELWLGKLTEDEKSAHFTLYPHKVITSINDQTLSAKDFSPIIEISNLEKLTINDSCGQVVDPNDKREKTQLKENVDAPIIVKFAYWVFTKTVFKDFLKLDIIQKYKNNEDFKNNNYYKIADYTDYDFYQKNKNILRVRNATADSFSLNESYLRHQAYAYTIDEKAHLFEIQTKNLNIDELGFFVDFENGKKVMNTDSALWTAMYLTSQAARYATVKNPEEKKIAFSNLKHSIEGIKKLTDVQNVEKNIEGGFARSLMKNTSENEPLERAILGKSYKYKNIYILHGGNNDMLKGIILSLAILHKAFEFDQDNEKSEIEELQDDIRDMIITLKQQKTEIGTNHVFIAGLDSLYSQRRTTEEVRNAENSYKEFLHGYSSSHGLLKILNLDHQFYYGGISDWSGINLSSVGNLALITIASELMNYYPSSYELVKDVEGNQGHQYLNATYILKDQKETLANLYKTFKNLKFDSLCLLHHTLNEKKKLNQLPDDCLTALKEMPVQLPKDAMVIDRMMYPDFVPSPNPKLPWKLFSKGRDLNNYVQANTLVPLFEGTALYTPMTWKETPYNKSYSKKENQILGRADYLYAYWISRYISEVINK